MKPLPKCEPLPPAIAAASRQAEERVSGALDRLLALLPSATYPKPTLLQEHMALHGMIEADAIRDRTRR